MKRHRHTPFLKRNFKGIELQSTFSFDLARATFTMSDDAGVCLRGWSASPGPLWAPPLPHLPAGASSLSAMTEDSALHPGSQVARQSSRPLPSC